LAFVVCAARNQNERQCHSPQIPFGASYDEAQIMAAVDLQLIDRLGWPITTPEAWPAVMRLEPRRTPRSATTEELIFVDACLRAIPDFINAKAPSQTRQVETGTRRVELHLASDTRSDKRA
jgi:hypothetical protein